MIWKEQLKGVTGAIPEHKGIREFIETQFEKLIDEAEKLHKQSSHSNSVSIAPYLRDSWLGKKSI